MSFLARQHRPAPQGETVVSLERQVPAGRAERLEAAPVDPAEVAGRGELITAAGDLRTLPSHFPHADPRMAGLDGFFAARLIKV